MFGVLVMGRATKKRSNFSVIFLVPSGIVIGTKVSNGALYPPM